MFSRWNNAFTVVLPADRTAYGQKNQNDLRPWSRNDSHYRIIYYEVAKPLFRRFEKKWNKNKLKRERERARKSARENEREREKYFIMRFENKECVVECQVTWRPKTLKSIGTTGIIVVVSSCMPFGQNKSARIFSIYLVFFWRINWHHVETSVKHVSVLCIVPSYGCAHSANNNNNKNNNNPQVNAATNGTNETWKYPNIHTRKYNNNNFNRIVCHLLN